MMKTYLRKKAVFFLLMASGWGINLYAQSESPLSVSYMVDYDLTQQKYTVWVVPQYGTPNHYNSDSEEKGATAQVTLKVPKSFTLNGLEDIRGNWDKTPSKIGQEAQLIKSGVDQNYAYYIIGKQAAETNYGTFKDGEPVSLFRFKGQGAKPEEVTILDNNDPFIHIANKSMALNVGSSFYSRSGQQPSVSVRPLEQFSQPITLSNVLIQLAKKLQANIGSMENELEGASELITFPNPVTTEITVKYFSKNEGGRALVQLIDPAGIVRYETSEVVKQGINTVKINVDKLLPGSYLVRTNKDKQVLTRKITKL